MAHMATAAHHPDESGRRAEPFGEHGRHVGSVVIGEDHHVATAERTGVHRREHRPVVGTDPLDPWFHEHDAIAETLEVRSEFPATSVAETTTAVEARPCGSKYTSISPRSWVKVGSPIPRRHDLRSGVDGGGVELGTSERAAHLATHHDRHRRPDPAGANHARGPPWPPRSAGSPLLRRRHRLPLWELSRVPWDAYRSPPPRSCTACGSTGMIADKPSRTPEGEPGRFTTSESPIVPATARDSAAIGVWVRPSARISSAKPGASRSMTARVASGVTSRGPNPVPPVVTTSPCDAESSVKTPSISRRSSGTTLRVVTSNPLARRIDSARSPDSSTREPRVTPSETVTTAVEIVDAIPSSSHLACRPTSASRGALEAGYAGRDARSHPEPGARDRPADRHVRQGRQRPAHLGDRPLQLPVHLLHACRGVAWLPKDEILTFEELTRLLRLFVRLGVESIKVTGGEPTVRADLPTLVAMFREAGPDLDISLTTNGVLLETLAAPLAVAESIVQPSRAIRCCGTASWR